MPMHVLSQPFKQTRTLLTASMVCLALLGCSNQNKSDNHTDTSSATQPKAQSSASPAAHNLPKDNDAQVVSALQDNLKASGINETIISAIPTDMPNIYWVTAEGLPSFFADKEGKFIIQGQIIQLGQEKPIDISSKLASRHAKQVLEAVDPNEMIIYSPKGQTKGIIYAFTDPTCPYCQKLHEEIPELNAKGIEVRYLAWPRYEQAWPLSKAIWCSPDKAQAMNDAKAGKSVNAPSCDDPVQKHVELGYSLGVRGTPAVFTQDGEQIGGYLPADDIAKALGVQ